jgi:hypothetical protein
MTSPSGPPNEPVIPIEQLFYDDGKPGIVDTMVGERAIALLDGSIAALQALASNPLSKPIALAEDEVVPIETLLYRGRAALDRAVELREAVRASPDKAALDELFDLLELARAS